MKLGNEPAIKAQELSEKIYALKAQVAHEIRAEIWRCFGHLPDRDRETYRALMQIAESARADASGGPYTSPAIYETVHRQAALSLGAELAKYSGTPRAFFNICKAAAKEQSER